MPKYVVEKKAISIILVEVEDASSPEEAVQLSKDLPSEYEEIVELLPTEQWNVTEVLECSLCGQNCDADDAHLHQGKYIGNECCWDERLKASE